MFAPHPKTAQDYQERADACVRRAEGALSPNIRETMLYLAHSWQVLADQEAARKKGIRPQPHAASPLILGGAHGNG